MWLAVSMAIHALIRKYSLISRLMRKSCCLCRCIIMCSSEEEGNSLCKVQLTIVYYNKNIDHNSWFSWGRGPNLHTSSVYKALCFTSPGKKLIRRVLGGGTDETQNELSCSKALWGRSYFCNVFHYWRWINTKQVRNFLSHTVWS